MALTSCLCLFMLGAPEVASEVPEQGFGIDAGLVTAVPVHVGAQVQVDLPHYLLLRLELGWMPPPYVDLINAGAQAFDAYGDETAELIRDGIQNSLILRASVGGRPFPDRNLEISGGYTLATLGGSAAAVEVVEAVFEQEINAPFLQDVGSVDLESTIHAFHADIGYRWKLSDDWIVRGSVGYVHVLSSDTTALVTTNEGTGRNGASTTVQSPALENYLDGLYTTYVRSPVLSVSASYRF